MFFFLHLDSYIVKGIRAINIKAKKQVEKFSFITSSCIYVDKSKKSRNIKPNNTSNRVEIGLASIERYNRFEQQRLLNNK